MKGSGSAARALLPGILLVSLPGLLPAQSVEPAEPGIVLPPVMLSVEDVSQAEIQTPLPQQSPPPLPAIEPALPDVAKLNVAQVSYNVPVPSASPSGAGASRQSSFYSEGTIGAGSMNQVIGEVSLYKIGADPRFSLHFSHDQLDGYDDGATFEPTGSGYFHRNDAIDGSLSAGNGSPFRLDSGASYTETEDGLQGLGDYSSVTHRFIDANVSSSYQSANPFGLTASVDGGIADTTLSASAPRNGAEYRATPDLGVTYASGALRASLDGFYGLTEIMPLAQDQAGPSASVARAGGTLSLKADVGEGLTLSGKVGVHWDPTNDLQAPFELDASGFSGDSFTYRLYGGYRVNDYSYADLWAAYPFIEEAGPLASSLSWYLGGTSRVRIGEELALDLGLEYSTDTAAVVPIGLSADGSGLFTFAQVASARVKPSFGLSWRPEGPFSLKGSWEGDFYESSPLLPISTFSLDAEVANRKNSVGGGLTGSLDLYTTGAQAPDIGLSGFVRASEGVLFIANVNDLVTPFVEGGRTLWGTYLEPGFNVTLKTEISF